MSISTKEIIFDYSYNRIKSGKDIIEKLEKLCTQIEYDLGEDCDFLDIIVEAINNIENYMNMGKIK